LAASGVGNTAVIWDAASGEQLLVVDGHSAPVIAVALSPDGGQLATAAADGTAMIWPVNLSEAATRLTAPDHILTGHTAEVTDVLFSPDGALIATAGRDDVIKLWDAASGAEIVTLAGHEGSVRDIAFSPDGAELFSAASDNSARIWTVSSGAERLVLNGHSDRLTDLALSPDGSRLATASWDGTIKVWDTASGSELLSFPGDSARVYAVAFSPDGRGWPAAAQTPSLPFGMRPPAKSSSGCRATKESLSTWPLPPTANGWRRGPMTAAAYLGRVAQRQPGMVDPGRSQFGDVWRGFQPGRIPAGDRQLGWLGQAVGRANRRGPRRDY
jgi:uncharacterized protein with WD repeat